MTSRIEMVDLPDSVLEYLGMGMPRLSLTLSDLACLASTCRRLHALLTPILHLRFSKVADTVLYFIRRDQQRIRSLPHPPLRCVVRYYPIGFNTLCMTYRDASFQYSIWNTSEKNKKTTTSLNDPSLQAALFCLQGIDMNTVYPITVRWGGLIEVEENQSSWEKTYPRKLFRVIKSCG